MAHHFQKLTGRFGFPKRKFNRNLALDNAPAAASSPASSSARAESLAKKPPSSPVACIGLEEWSLELDELRHDVPTLDEMLGHFPALAFDKLQSLTICDHFPGRATASHRINLWNSIFESAPALHTLRMFDIMVGSKEGHNENVFLDSLCSPQNLRCLKLQFITHGIDDYQFLENMLLVSKKVETLSIEGPFDSHRTVRAALPLKDTVRVLDMQLEEMDMDLMDKIPSPLHELATFTVLEKLKMNEAVVHLYDGVDGFGIDGLRNKLDEPGTLRCLVDSIPVSVQEFTLETLTNPNFECLSLLAEDMSRGRFPNLRRVVINNFDMEDNESLEWRRDGDRDGGFLQYIRREFEIRNWA